MAELSNAWKSSEDLLNKMKQRKKEELSHDCQEGILSRFESEVQDEVYSFSYDQEAQTNLQERLVLFQNNMVEEISVTARDISGTPVRLIINQRDFEQIYIDSVLHKEEKIKKLRDDLFPLVDNTKTEEAVEEITWGMTIVAPAPDTVVLQKDRTIPKEITNLQLESMSLSRENTTTMMALMQLVDSLEQE